MDIKDVEKQLSVSRANIRFYEKEGLIVPLRRKNNYRDYSEEDVARLKKILVLRKMGFSIQEIRSLQNGELQMEDAAVQNIQRLETAIEELKGSLSVSKELAKEHPSFETMDEDRYWAMINSASRRGQAFLDICKDCLEFERDQFDEMWKRSFHFDLKSVRKKHGVWVAIGIILLLCTIRGLAFQFIWQGTFLEGFLNPFVVFVVGSLIILPLYLLGKKAPRAAGAIASGLLVLILLFFALLGVGIIALLFNAVFHFWW